MIDTLPTGLTALDASAGTGKTYALSELAVRYVVEAGVPIDALAVVTFTRAAAAELRSRIRVRLAEAADSEVTTQSRARTALEDFESATITTIHGFAGIVLAGLGASSPEADLRLADDDGDLLRQVCIDRLVAGALGGGEENADLNRLYRVARVCATNPDARRVPGPDDDATDEEHRLAGLVAEVLTETDRRRRAAATMSFDDLLVRLRDRLVDPVTGSAARRVLANRFRVALIDEFQDTDPVQWAAFASVFGLEGDGRALVVVGDPKQAIYAFRGADVHTYLDAVESADRRVLDQNWRSDQPLLDGVATLLDGVTFGDDRISFEPVSAPPHHQASRLGWLDGQERAPVSIRLALPPAVPVTRSGHARAAETNRLVYADLAEQVRSMLEHARLHEDDGTTRALRPRDVAVLVNANSDGPAVRRALAEVGIQAVVARGDAVTATPAATQWRILLDALAQPGDPRRARAACLSWFVGLEPADLVDDDADRRVGAVQEQLHDWAELLARQGPAALVAKLRSDSGVVARVLSRPGGERSITDLDHVAELLLAAAPPRTGPAGLAATLARLDARVLVDEAEMDLHARRAESEADAVQIMTIHVAKGLEFPVVCCPTLHRAPALNKPFVFHDPETDRRTIDVASVRERERLARQDHAGQLLRLLYVALTRARHRLVLWWAPTQNSSQAALTRILSPGGDAIDLDALGPLVERSAGTIEVARVEPASSVRWRPEIEDVTDDLGCATLDRALDRSLRRWSFSALAPGHDTPRPDPLDPSLGDARAGDEPWADLPAGARFGNLVHDVLEHTDFAAADLDAELAARVGDDAALISALALAIEAPLGPLFDGRRLRDLTRRDRLDELAFDLRLADGGAPTDLGAIGACVREHLDGDHPLVPWAASLGAAAPSRALAGHLTGFVDLVARVGDTFVVVDYKTNRLEGYGPAELAAAMAAHHYPLQALLYLVATHRFLRWRLAAYDPAVHLGGIAYLFLRGLRPDAPTGPSGEVPGVFAWSPPVALVDDLSDLLEGLG